jgi:hypothetical protein
MSPLMSEAAPLQEHTKALKIIAKSLFRELKENGYDSRQIVTLTSELISLVTSDLRDHNRRAVAS